MAEYVPNCGAGLFTSPCATQMDTVLSYCTTPQTAAAVRYLWWHCGQGIYVRVVDGAIAEFVPFVSGASNVRTPLKYAVRKRLSASEVKDVLVPESEFWDNYASAYGASDASKKTYDARQKPALCVDGAHVTFNKTVQELAPVLQASMQQVLGTEACREALNDENFEFVINVQSAAVRKDGKCPQTLDALPHDIFPHWLALQNKVCVLSLSASRECLDAVWPLKSEAALRAHVAHTVAMLEKPPFLKRENVATFRGAPSGLGTVPEDNTRLFILKLSKEVPHLIDAKATSNCTDLQLADLQLAGIQVVKFVRPLRGADASKVVPLYEQVARKYVLFAGHSSIAEVLDDSLASFFACGFCVIFVEPMNPVQAWFQHALKPWVHYVPVHKSKLVKMLEWLNANPDKADRIARQGETFARTVLSDVSTLALGAKLLQIMARPKKRTICDTLGFSF